MNDDDIFMAMIKEEINQYSHILWLADQKSDEDINYKKMANKSLQRTRILGLFVVLIILIFSLLSVQQFIQFGTTGSFVDLSAAIIAWALVLIFTIFYSRNIHQNKKSMERILKLLDARKEHYLHDNLIKN